MYNQGMAPTKDARLNLRMREAETALIRKAAAETGQSMSEFMASSALERAFDVLADKRSFVLGEDRWEEFMQRLDRPARPDERLVELFSEKSSIERR